MQAALRTRYNAYYRGARISLWASLVPDRAGERYAISVVLPGGVTLWWTGAVNAFSDRRTTLTSAGVQPNVKLLDDEHITMSLAPGVYTVHVWDEQHVQIAIQSFALADDCLVCSALAQQIDQDRAARASACPHPDARLVDGHNCERWQRDRVMAVLKAAWPGCPQFALTDGSYLVPQQRLVRFLAAITGIEQRRYESDHDCDDFTFAWCGWMHVPGLSGGSWGYAIGPGHAMGVAVCSDATVWLVEPQTGILQSALERAERGWTPTLVLI